jgi:DNA-directed RNA polymerase specialized sigma24 family protein
VPAQVTRERLDLCRPGGEAHRRGERLLELIPDPSRSPPEAAELSEEVQELRGQFSAAEPQREPGTLAACLGYSYREIGEITGWIHTKINRCVSEGRAALRKAHAHEVGAPPFQAKRHRN